MKFTSWFVNKQAKPPSAWPLAKTLRSSEQSSKNFSENLTEIDNNTSKKGLTS